jgi:hypothetical protein
LNFKVHPVAKGVKTKEISKKDPQLPFLTNFNFTNHSKWYFSRPAKKIPLKISKNYRKSSKPNQSL